MICYIIEHLDCFHEFIPKACGAFVIDEIGGQNQLQSRVQETTFSAVANGS